MLLKLRDEVDDMLLLQLKNLKAQLTSGGGKKGKKGKGKKGKGKKREKKEKAKKEKERARGRKARGERERGKRFLARRLVLEWDRKKCFPPCRKSISQQRRSMHHR